MSGDTERRTLIDIPVPMDDDSVAYLRVPRDLTAAEAARVAAVARAIPKDTP